MPALTAGAVLAALRLAVSPLREQWRRRGAESVAGTVRSPAAPLFEEALGLLSGDAATLAAALGHVAKRQLSGVPDEFAIEDVRVWLQQDHVRAWLIAAARAEMIGGIDEGAKQAAVADFERALPDVPAFAADVVELAVTFLVLTVHAKSSPGERANLDALDWVHDSLSGQVAARQPTALVDPFINEVVGREERWRSIVDPDRIAHLLTLCERVRDGDLHAASGPTQIALFRTTAAALSRTGRHDDAAHWIEQARALGANDLVVDDARVALHRGDLDQVFTLLRDRADDPVARFMLADAVRQRDGVEPAIEFLRDGKSDDQLSGFARTTLARWLTELGRWDEGEAVLAAATKEQVEQNPALLYIRMRHRLAMMLPEGERRAFVDDDKGLPRSGMLGDDARCARLRTDASADAAAFLLPAAELGPERTEWFEVQQLYLGLAARQGPEFEAARAQVIARAAATPVNLLFCGLAMSHHLAFDKEPLRAELARRERLGGLSPYEEWTRFQLALDDGDPDALDALIAQRSDLLSGAGVPRAQLIGIRIEVAARQGRSDDAAALLEQEHDRLDPVESARLQALISDAEGKEQAVAGWREAFAASGADEDLRHLVGAMLVTTDPELGARAVELWHRQRRTDIAVTVADTLFNEGRDAELDDLLAAIGDDGDANAGILRHRAWAAFRNGHLDEARYRTLALRATEPDDAGLRQLAVNIALESGHWHELVPLAHEDLVRREQRTARVLLQSAEFAGTVDDPVADALAHAAVEKGWDDVQVLLAAHGFAVRRGFDQAAEVGVWLQRAIELSGDSGPIRSFSLPAMPEMIRERREQQTALSGMIMGGQVPLELIAGPLGLTLGELILKRLAESRAEPDPLRRLTLPLVAGNRLPGDLTGAERVAFDMAAIYALELFGLLEVALRTFPRAVLPASTMPQLFGDVVRAKRGQPSRAAQGARLRALIDAGRLRVVDVPDGDDRDGLELAHAQANGMRYVHGFPMHEPGDLTLTPRSMDAASAGIVSPAGVVDALKAAGELGANAAETVRAALFAGARERWSDEPVCGVDDPLLVDMVSLDAMEAAGALSTALYAGMIISISRWTADTIDSEVREGVDHQVAPAAMLEVKRKLVAAVTARTAIHARHRRTKSDSDEDEDEMRHAPLATLLGDAASFDVLVSGDRAINRTGMLTDRAGIERPIFTILDVVDHLERTGAIDAARREKVWREVREAGAALIPATVEEIVAAAGEGDWSRGPGRALRAIVASVHLPILRGAVVLPDEEHWLREITANIAMAIRQCWAVLPQAHAEQAATYLVSGLPDLDVAAKGVDAPGFALWSSGARAGVHALVAMPVDVPLDRRGAYLDWYASVVQPRLGGRDLDVRDRVAGIIAEVIAAQDLVTIDGQEIPAREVRRWMIAHVPWPLRRAVLQRREMRDRIGEPDGTLDLGDAKVDLNTLAGVATRAFAGERVTLLDVDGELVSEQVEASPDGALLIQLLDQRLRVDEAGMFAADLALRRATYARLLSSRTLPSDEVDATGRLLEERPLSGAELEMLLVRATATPQVWIKTLLTKAERLNFPMLARTAEDLRVFFMPDLARPLSEVLMAEVARRSAQPGLVETARTLAPLAVSPDLDIMALTSPLTSAETLRLVERLIEDGDAYSLVAAFRLACDHPAAEELRGLGTRLLARLFGDEGAIDAVAHDFAAAATAVIGHADVSGTLRDVPLSQRRALLLAHAGWVARLFRLLDVKRPETLANVDAWIGKVVGLAGVTDRFDSRWWLRDWLRPAVVAGHVKARLRAALSSVPNAERPPEWNCLLGLAEDGVTVLAPSLTEQVCGPLDEFSPAWSTTSFDVRAFRALLDPLHGDSWDNLLLHALMMEEVPDDSDRARDMVLAGLDVTSCGLCEGVDATVEPDRQLDESVAQRVRFALIAAHRWRDPQLAEAALAFGMERATARRWAPALPADWAIAAAAVHEDRQTQEEALVRHLEHVADRLHDGAEAGLLGGVIDRVIDSGIAPIGLRRLRARLLLVPPRPRTSQS